MDIHHALQSLLTHPQMRFYDYELLPQAVVRVQDPLQFRNNPWTAVQSDLLWSGILMDYVFIPALNVIDISVLPMPQELQIMRDTLDRWYRITYETRTSPYLRPAPNGLEWVFSENIMNDDADTLPFDTEPTDDGLIVYPFLADSSDDSLTSD